MPQHLWSSATTLHPRWYDVTKAKLTDSSSRDVQDDIVEEESGWKLIHGDVFRYPENINAFSALIGAGAHVS